MNDGYILLAQTAVHRGESRLYSFARMRTSLAVAELILAKGSW
ncbi:hypothetical protein [Chroococcidiopsis sp. CCNUC1]|jgi:hypothetical protein|uniref:Uncharacterized protein n=1 Tax=Chroococcidiopsis thermalis (strain PCC 7203) TaxID=251229 RepID=K9U3M0_CHRTP|nr:hypothetical protein [Chroococcidiopsis sp. CCNUC1]AFY89233.1 hypothetical protein Chro_3806 [Chroococcidiopsis thermalis PCC 7203]